MSSTDHCEQLDVRPAAGRSPLHVRRMVATHHRERAWSALLNDFKDLVARVAWAHDLDDRAAAEVATATWQQMFEHLGGETVPGELGGWLAKTAQRECLRLLWAAGDKGDESPLLGTVVPAEPAPEPVLQTLVFTDIVRSTECAVRLGDRGWGELLRAHDAAVRRELTRWGGTEVKTTGDGFLAIFDCPAQAIRCAAAITDRVRALGIEVRAGVHTGECELGDHEVGGIAVHIAARITALARAHEVLVSTTVKELVRGSGLRFADRGAHVLKGLPDRWRLCAVKS